MQVDISHFDENSCSFLERLATIGGSGLGVTRSALDLGEIRGLSLCRSCCLLELQHLCNCVVWGNNFLKCQSLSSPPVNLPSPINSEIWYGESVCQSSLPLPR